MKKKEVAVGKTTPVKIADNKFIRISCTNIGLNIPMMDLDVFIAFAAGYPKSKSEQKILEITADLEIIAKKYFDANFETEVMDERTWLELNKRY